MRKEVMQGMSIKGMQGYEQRMYKECTRKTQGISKDCAKKCEKILKEGQ